MEDKNRIVIFSTHQRNLRMLSETEWEFYEV